MNEWVTRAALQFSNVHDMRQYTHAAQYAKLPGSFPYKINIGAFKILLQLILDQIEVGFTPINKIHADIKIQ